MRLSRPPITAYLALFLVCMGLLALNTLGGCSKNQRADTVRASFVAVNAARDGFTTWDHGQQQQIVRDATSREDGQQKIDAYRASRATVIADFEVAYHLLAVAATQTDKISLDAAVKEATELVAAIDRILHPPSPSSPPGAPSHLAPEVR